MTIVDTAGSIVRDLGEHGRVVFQETPRRAYYLEAPGEAKGKRLVSVTTVLGCLDKGEGLRRWMHSQSAGAALAAVRMGELDPAIHHDDEAGGITRALGLGPDARRDAAAEDGLTMHDAVAHWAEGGDLPNPTDLKPSERAFLPGLARVLLALDPEPTAVEQLTCHPALGYAGRFDLRCAASAKDTLLDFKFRERPATRETDVLQLNGYAKSEESLGAPMPDQMLAIAIGIDGSFVIHEVDVPDDAFERVLSVYRLLADVRRPLDAARRAAKKAQEAAKKAQEAAA